MEATRLKTIDDLSDSRDERIELIDGEIVRRPMARSEHALAQSGLSDEIQPLKRKDGPGGWWIMTEISVQYSEHQCPCHDLAGWRKERVPKRPTGIMTTRPDWVSEILSPGHERKDLVHHFMLLQRFEVPYYWIISPEDRTVIAYALDGNSYRVAFSAECKYAGAMERARIPPFEAVAIDLHYVLGEDS